MAKIVFSISANTEARGFADLGETENTEATDKEITVVTEMPENDFNPKNQCGYHIDPHPRFTENEKYVVFTTTELGSVDLALASVDELLALTK